MSSDWRQLIWLLNELIRMNIHDSDTVLALVIRHIIGGDVGPRNLWLLQQVLGLLVEHRYTHRTYTTYTHTTHHTHHI